MLKVGDRNTGFSNHMENSHLRKNTIARIKINDDWIYDELEPRKGISNMAWRVEIDGLPFSTLSSEEASSLELPLREEEVFIALNHSC